MHGMYASSAHLDAKLKSSPMPFVQRIVYTDKGFFSFQCFFSVSIFVVAAFALFVIWCAFNFSVRSPMFYLFMYGAMGSHFLYVEVECIGF